MDYKIFIHLPEDLDEEFEVGNPDSFEEVIKDLIALKSIVKPLQFRFYYDSENIKTFLSLSEFVKDVGYLERLDTKLKRIISSYSTNITVLNPSFGDLNHYRWLGTEEANHEKDLTIRFASECDPNKSHIVLLNFNNHLKEPNEYISIIRDSKGFLRLPELRKLSYSIDFIDFKHWLKSTSSGVFNLKDEEFFTPTPFMWKKQRIYQHNETKQYWYYDFFHKENKEHFEVFSPDGSSHLGEANSKGDVDLSKRSSKKRINHILK